MKKVSEPIAWRTSLIYWLISALWILVSDRLLAAFVADAKTISLVQSYKGWGFVTGTAFFLYAGLRAQLADSPDKP